MYLTIRFDFFALGSSFLFGGNQKLRLTVRVIFISENLSGLWRLLNLLLLNLSWLTLYCAVLGLRCHDKGRLDTSSHDQVGIVTACGRRLAQHRSYHGDLSWQGSHGE